MKFTGYPQECGKIVKNVDKYSFHFAFNWGKR